MYSTRSPDLVRAWRASFHAPDDVVEQIDVEDLCGLHREACDLDIGRGGSGVAGWMTVRKDQGGVGTHGLFEDLGLSNLNAVDRAPVDHVVMGDAIAAVEQQYPELLLIKALKRRVDMVEEIASGIDGAGDDHAFLDWPHKAAHAGLTAIYPS